MQFFYVVVPGVNRFARHLLFFLFTFLIQVHSRHYVVTMGP